jgi:type VI protein secretion system component Hcp
MVRYGTRLLITGLLAGSFFTPQAAAQIRAASEPAAAADIFLKLPDIKGEAGERGHEGWIHLESWQFSKPGVPSGPGTLTITKRADTTSRALGQKCSARQSLGEVVVHVPSNQRGRYTEYVLQSVTVSSCTQARGVESLSLNYEKISTRAASIVASPSR